MGVQMKNMMAFCLLAVSASVASEEYPEWDTDPSREPEYLRTCEEYAQGTVEMLQLNPLYDDALYADSYISKITSRMNLSVGSDLMLLKRMTKILIVDFER
jgi:hypothetical protein